MRILLALTAVAGLVAAPALAQTAMPASPGTGTTTGSSNPAVNRQGNAPSNVNMSGKAQMVAASALEKGSNSFTEGRPGPASKAPASST